MDWQSDCAVLIPCFNESRNIQSVVAGALKYFVTVIVVDDGSSDATAEYARAAGASVTRLSRNSGKGAALHHGRRLAGSLGFSWLLLMDGDGQHAAEDIPRFLQAAEASGAKLVIGNRMGARDKMPRIRRWVNQWMSWEISRLAGETLPDSQCGFRLVHLETWSRLPIAAQHFEIESELALAFVAAGCPVKFVPVQVIYQSNGSKIRPLLDGVRWLRWWFAQSRTVRARPALNLGPAVPISHRWHR